MFGSVRTPCELGLICGMHECGVGARQDADKWFAVIQGVDARGKRVQMPEGPLCFPCGLTCIVWPLVPHRETIDKYNDVSQRTFRLEFDTTKKALQGVIMRTFPEETCRRAHRSSMSVYMKLVFVLLPHFKAKWQDPASLSIPICQLPTPGGHTAQGVLFQCHNFPWGEIPGFCVKISVSKYLEFEKCILNARDIQRKEQCWETFLSREKVQAAGRPACLKDLKPQFGAAMTISQVDTAYKAAQDAMKQQNSLRQFQVGNTDEARAAGLSVQEARRVVAGGFGDDEDDLQVSPANKRRKTSGAGAGGKSGARIPAATPIQRIGFRSKRPGALGASASLAALATPSSGSTLVPSTSGSATGAPWDGDEASEVLAMETASKGSSKRLELTTEDEYLRVLKGDVLMGYARNGVDSLDAPASLAAERFSLAPFLQFPQARVGCMLVQVARLVPMDVKHARVLREFRPRMCLRLTGCLRELCALREIRALGELRLRVMLL